MTDQWQLITVTGKAPIDATSFSWVIYQVNGGENTVYIDNVLIEKAGVALPYF